MSEIFFESNTDSPVEFEYAGETIENFGDVKIVSADFLNRLLHDAEII